MRAKNGCCQEVSRMLHSRMFEAVLIVLRVPNWSEEPSSKLTGIMSSWNELLKLKWAPNSSTPSFSLILIMNMKKKVPRVFYLCSENEEDVATFPDIPWIMVWSEGEPSTARLSIEVSDSSDLFSRSRVSVEEAKSCPCSTGVDLLVSRLVPFPSVRRSAGS